MKKLQLIVSFDYELPLGGCSDYEKGLFVPAGRVLDLARKLELPVCFFVDALCAVQFKDWDFEKFYKPLQKQITKLLRQNGEVQLHLHPHWMTSKFENGRFLPSHDKTFLAFADETGHLSIENIIKKGANELNGLASEVIPGYQCVAYRGGGYNIQPYTDLIFRYLQNAGICIDSSILKGYYFATETQQEDYRSMPSTPNWYIPFNGNIREPAQGGMFEIPIATAPISVVAKLAQKLKKRKNFTHRTYDNSGSTLFGCISKKQKIKNFYYRLQPLTFDGIFTDLDTLQRVLDHNLHLYKDYENPVLSINSHPKCMCNYHLHLMEDFVAMVSKKYAGQVEFTTYSAVAETLRLQKVSHR